jgi:hypothetical protein
MAMSPNQQAQKDRARADSSNAFNRSWRSPEKESEDKARLAKEHQDLANMENRRRWFGGGDHNSGFYNQGTSNQELEDQRKDIDLHEKYEKQYTLDKAR